MKYLLPVFRYILPIVIYHEVYQKVSCTEFKKTLKMDFYHSTVIHAVSSSTSPYADIVLLFGKKESHRFYRVLCKNIQNSQVIWTANTIYLENVTWNTHANFTYFTSGFTKERWAVEESERPRWNSLSNYPKIFSS